MHHLSSPEQTRRYLGEIIGRIRRGSLPLAEGGCRPLKLPELLEGLAEDGNNGQGIILLMSAIAQFTDLDDETEAITLQLPYERHDDETLARMVWHALLQGACSQHPAAS